MSDHYSDERRVHPNLRYVPKPAILKTCSNCGHKKHEFYYKGKERYTRYTYCELSIPDEFAYDKKPLEQNMVCDNWATSNYYEKDVLSLNASIEKWSGWNTTLDKSDDDSL